MVHIQTSLLRIMAKKAPSKKAAAKKAVKAAKKAATPAHVIALHNQHPSDSIVLGCIRAQAGGAIITANATLGGLGVSGFTLAGCINGQLGTNFTGADFPPSMTVAQCVFFVR